MDLDLKRLKSRIDWFCLNKVNAFSPTISPAPKSMERNEIESIYEGIRYFYEKGVREIVVQRKYMGSYCDIYLHKDINSTYFVSRNAHLINHIDLEKAKEACRELHARLDWEGISMYIIQSELMPWSALGKGLIENEFESYLAVHRNHYNYLLNSNLYRKIDDVKLSKEYISYIECKDNCSKAELKNKYPAHIIRQYDALSKLKIVDLDSYQVGIDVYDEQIKYFGRIEDLYFKPFNILKKIFDNGEEEIPNDNLTYQLVNSDECLVLSISDEEAMNKTVEKVYAWFHSLETAMEEGIVIKPRQAFSKGLPPAFKVRNNRYLTMIYGVDFLEAYSQNMWKRKITRKLECSINDWMINWEIVKVPYKEIHPENYYLKNLVYDRIMRERIESTLDTRL